jgi:hypothetical protein
MELWMFDRSGLYSCEKFSIHQDPHRFIKIVAGYSLMSDQELGVNTHIKGDKIGKYILFKEGKEKEERIYLEDKPIASQKAIVCRGTTCYRAKMSDSEEWEYVVKFAWRSDKRPSEGQLLKLAKERKVWGVAELCGHQDLETIHDLRQGLQFGKSKTFRSARKDSINLSHSRARGSLLANGLGISLTSASSSGQKRKRRDEPPTSRKRSKSSSRKRSDTGSLVKEQVDRAVGDSEHGPAEPNANSLTALDDEDDGSFENRIFSCLVISPPGRAIHEFASVEELLEACRDFIKGHRSLYCEGRILHRDFSENNLIITKTKQEGDPKGTLIDLDLAKELDGGPSGARHRTGTMEFMAIEVLEGRPHTYRHDMESLFYVFLWVIICHLQGASQGLLKGSQLRGWYRGSYAEIAGMKRGHMDKKRFKGILTEFPLAFEGLKSLAEELRDILFPIREESLFTGTYGDPDKLYQPMIDAFDRAIARQQVQT